ncbi:MAG: DUF2865 domain-containing protein [Xanthobacteraceae bacterium]
MAALFGRSHPFACAALVAGVALAAIGIPEPAQAQGLFDVLRNIFGGQRPRVERMEPPLLLDGFPEDGIGGAPAESGGPYVAYCVRLCDGRFFPLPRNAGSPSMTPEKVCGAMCPAAQTKVFSGTNISRAIASDGKNYAGLQNAFVYRDKLVDNCACTTKSTTGVAAIDVENDPTLRRGDVVVTRDGPKVFTGDSRLPHKPSDFVPAEGYKGLPKGVQKQVSELRVSEDGSEAPAVPARVTRPVVLPEVTPPAPVGSHASLSYAPAKTTPIAEAFSTFRR